TGYRSRRMDNQLLTIRSEPDAPEGQSSDDAFLVQIYPTGSELGTRYVLRSTPLVIGRGSDCEIRINDNSVSRRHAVVQPGEDGWTITDLGSTNGIFLN